MNLYIRSLTSINRFPYFYIKFEKFSLLRTETRHKYDSYHTGKYYLDVLGGCEVLILNKYKIFFHSMATQLTSIISHLTVSSVESNQVE